MAQELPKQLIMLRGRPVLAWSLLAFAPIAQQIIIPTSEQVRPAIEGLIAQMADDLPAVHIVAGGDTRQQSVAEGMRHVAPDIAMVLVHDAARPCIRREDITALLTTLQQCPAAILATPCHATVKYSDDGNTISRTLDRSPLWLAATPQGFHYSVGQTAFHQAAEAGTLATATDDAQIVHDAGIEVHLVTGRASNIKITTADDLAIAAAILAATAAEDAVA